MVTCNVCNINAATGLYTSWKDSSVDQVKTLSVCDDCKSGLKSGKLSIQVEKGK